MAGIAPPGGASKRPRPTSRQPSSGRTRERRRAVPSHERSLGVQRSGVPVRAAALALSLIPPRAPPSDTEGVIPWLKRNLCSDWKNTLGTLIVLAVIVRYVPPLLQWAVF